MTILGRTLAILAAALIVCGITWSIGRSITFSGGPGIGRPDFAVAGQTTQAGAGSFQPRGRPEGGGGFFGVVQLGQNLGLLAIIVVIGQVVLAALRRRFPTPADRRKVASTA